MLTESSEYAFEYKTSPSKGNLQYVYLTTIVAAVGGLLFGYDTAVIAGAIGFLQTKFELSAAMKGWAVSSAIVGCAIGAMSAGYLSDRFGRKKVLLLTALLFGISAIGSAIPNNLTQFAIARLIGGVGVGAASMLSPMYISEIAPANIRGRLVTLYQLAIVIGILLIYFVNMLIAGSGNETWNVDVGWRYMFASEAIPSLLFFALLFLVPESPRWLAKKGRDKEALKVLYKINGAQMAGEVLQEIKKVLAIEKGTFKELFEPGLRTAMIVGIVLAIFSQITGINAIMYYAPEIFKSVGIGTDSALLQTVLIGAVNLAFTFVAIWLIDILGRRTLLLYGVAGMTICLLGLGAAFYFDYTQGPWILIFILGYIACFASSLGPIPWVLIAEIFPTKNRGIAMSVAILSLWIGVYLISQFFPVLLKNFGGAFTFWLFMVNAIILFIFTLKMIPETKGKTLEEIELSWKK